MKEQEKNSSLDPAREEFNQRIRAIADNPFVARAFSIVDRGLFVPQGSKHLAYQDGAIQLEEGASNSQPSLIALMMDHLYLDGKGRVLEIGTGSGYQAALLSCCAFRVYTIERNERLALGARERLASLGFNNVEVHIGDGCRGIRGASFDAIIVTAGAREIPRALVGQLREGGRIVLPVGSEPYYQQLVVGVKHFGQLDIRNIYGQGFSGRVSFHPLVSEAPGGWTEEAIAKAKQPISVEETLIV